MSLATAIAPLLSVVEGVSPAEWAAAVQALVTDVQSKTTLTDAALDVLAAAVPTLDEDIALARFGLALAPYLKGKDLGAVPSGPYAPGYVMGDDGN